MISIKNISGLSAKNKLINLIKESAVISYIGGYYLMRRVHLIAAAQYTYFFPALCYYIMFMVITIIGRYIEKRLKYD